MNKKLSIVCLTIMCTLTYLAYPSDPSGYFLGDSKMLLINNEFIKLTSTSYTIFSVKETSTAINTLAKTMTPFNTGKTFLIIGVILIPISLSFLYENKKNNSQPNASVWTMASLSLLLLATGAYLLCNSEQQTTNLITWKLSQNS